LYFFFFLIFAVRKEKRKIISQQYTEIQKRLGYVLHYRSIVARFPRKGGWCKLARVWSWPLLPSTAEVRNTWGYTSTTTYIFRAR